MHYLALQIAAFLLIAIIIGVVLGWWIKGILVDLQLEDYKNQRISDHRNLKDAREQLFILQAKYDRAQQQIDKYTAHYNSNTYGQYIEARKALESARKEQEALLAELNQTKANLKHLQHQLEQLDNINDSYNHTQKLMNHSKHIEIDVEDAYDSDDLKKISGITQETERQLNSLGILKYRQIAEFTLQDAEMIAKYLNSVSLPDYNVLVSTAKDLHFKKYSHQAA